LNISVDSRLQRYDIPFADTASELYMTEPSDIEACDSGQDGPRLHPRVLHVVVGYGLRTYFINAVRSVRSVAPDNEILVVDNASPDNGLRVELARIADEDPQMRLLLRNSNDLTNEKVGSLYDAYQEVFDLAIGEGFEYLHLVQGDMQVLWWDDEVVSRATEIFDSKVRCVNIRTQLLSSDITFSDGLNRPEGGELASLRYYGITDTGLYHLARWREFDMSFANSERTHAQKYLAKGFTVICHPWPTVAPIPWPAVIRRGVQIGREVVSVKPFLLEPLSSEGVTKLKQRNWTWLEDICIPWGWTCLTPMWTTDLNSDYLAARRQDAALHGLVAGLPHWERRGLGVGRWQLFWRSQYRPSLLKLFVLVPIREFMSRLKRRMGSAFEKKYISP
jgi:hypothetical protein